MGPWDSLSAMALSGGPWALIGFFLLSVWRGWLIPKALHQERIDDLKAANRALEETVREQKKQIGILLGAREPTP